MATDLCVRVLKFSSATGVRPDTTIPWTHLQANNLFVVIKGKEACHPNGTLKPDGKLDMTVVQDTRVLESIDIAGYVDAAMDARRGAERVGVTPQVDQLPIFGITKDSVLAIRYRLGDGQARRLQLRMQTTAECRKVVSALEQRGMEFQEQRPRTARPGTAWSMTSSLAPDRLPTAHSSSPYFESPRPPSQQCSFAEEGTRSDNLSPSHAPPSGLLAHPVLQPSSMPPSLHLNRDELSASWEAASSSPSTAQARQLYTTPSQPSQHGRQAKPAESTDGRPCPTSHVATFQALREAAEGVAPPTTMPPPFSRHSHTNENGSSVATEVPLDALLSSDPPELRPQTARPSTSATSALPESQEFEIPPKRELPFKRPESRRNYSGRVSRPGSSALTLPPLPKPMLVKGGSGSPGRADSASPTRETCRAGNTSPLKRSFDAVEECAPGSVTTSTTRSDVQQPHRHQLSPVTTTAPSKTIAPERSACHPSKIAKAVHDQRSLPDGPNHTKYPRVANLTDALRETGDTLPASSPSKADVTTPGYEATKNAYAAIQSATTHSKAASVDEYATQNIADRQAALEEFMIENLENPAFTKLCEDIENCWRRIALGL